MSELVSVLIPSIARPSLLRSVESAMSQTGEVEVVVALDLREGSDPLSLARQFSEIRLCWTGGGKGPSAARNLALSHSRGEWICYMDDDDVWLPGKLDAQLRKAGRIAREGYRPIVASKYYQVGRHGARSISIPKVRFDGHQKVEEYLFVNRRLGAGRATIHPSTILCHRSIPLDVPWDPSLRLHEDWDWLIRACREPLVALHQLPDHLVQVALGSIDSLSAKAQSEASTKWAEEAFNDSPKVLADFLAAQCLRYALSDRQIRGSIGIIHRIRQTGMTPSMSNCLIGLTGIAGRETLERLMSKIR